jgi:hypothetical protein
MDSLITRADGSMSFGDQRDLDEHCLDNILAYINDAPARGTCKKWASHIFRSCHLEDKIRLKKLLQAKGSLEFDCFATRELGPDIMETVSFHFDFLADGKFDLQWYHSYSGDMDPQTLRGKWHAQGKALVCEYTNEPEEGPVGRVLETGDATNEHNFISAKRSATWPDLTCAPSAGIIFNVPQDLVFAGQVTYEDDHPDSVSFPWKLSKIILSDGHEDSDHASTIKRNGFSQEELDKYAKLPLCARSPEQDPDAHYVVVDGRRIVVCTDIVAKYPEESWATLMRFRSQFDTA